MTEFPRISKRETTLLAGHFLMFFLIPYIPRQVLLLTDSIIVRLLLLFILISSAYVSPLIAIATFVLIALLFVERNKHKMMHLESVMQQSTPESPAIESIQTPETAPEQPDFDTPIEKGIPFMPSEETGEDSFAPVDKTINEKVPLPTEESNEGVQKAIDQLYGWVNPDLIQQSP
jgi:hypothetical protein